MLYDQVMRILELDASNEEKVCRVSDFIEGSVERAEESATFFDLDADSAFKSLRADLWGGYDDEE